MEPKIVTGEIELLRVEQLGKRKQLEDLSRRRNLMSGFDWGWTTGILWTAGCWMAHQGWGTNWLEAAAGIVVAVGSLAIHIYIKRSIKRGNHHR